MRKKLQKYSNKRNTFIGTFIKKGLTADNVDTVLLRNITTIKNKVVADHMWFRFSRIWKSLGKLQEGDLIQFDAKSIRYIKGYSENNKRERDYRLTYLTNVKVIK